MSRPALALGGDAVLKADRHGQREPVIGWARRTSNAPTLGPCCPRQRRGLSQPMEPIALSAS